MLFVHGTPFFEGLYPTDKFQFVKRTQLWSTDKETTVCKVLNQVESMLSYETTPTLEAWPKDRISSLTSDEKKQLYELLTRDDVTSLAGVLRTLGKYKLNDPVTCSVFFTSSPWIQSLLAVEDDASYAKAIKEFYFAISGGCPSDVPKYMMDTPPALSDDKISATAEYIADVDRIISGYQMIMTVQKTHRRPFTYDPKELIFHKTPVYSGLPDTIAQLLTRQVRILTGVKGDYIFCYSEHYHVLFVMIIMFCGGCLSVVFVEALAKFWNLTRRNRLK